MSHDPYADVVNRLFPCAELKNMERLTGGVSADVYRLDLILVDGRTTSVVLRAHSASSSGHSVALEYQLLQKLHRCGMPVPEPLLVDISGSLLTDSYLVMAFVEGSSKVPAAHEGQYIDAMASTLRNIHAFPAAELPTLPERIDPLSEVFDNLPDGREWADLRAHLRSLADTAYVESPKLLHGDFWPENLLWQNGAVAAIVDWEDAALGDPLSDVACCQLELRYKFGEASMRRFTQEYASHRELDTERLALWQVSVAAAALRLMGKWGLTPALEKHMRSKALACIQEAGAVLMDQSGS